MLLYYGCWWLPPYVRFNNFNHVYSVKVVLYKEPPLSLFSRPDIFIDAENRHHAGRKASNIIVHGVFAKNHGGFETYFSPLEVKMCQILVDGTTLPQAVLNYLVNLEGSYFQVVI